jgi:NTE family protein
MKAQSTLRTSCKLVAAILAVPLFTSLAIPLLAQAPTVPDKGQQPNVPAVGTKDTGNKSNTGQDTTSASKPASPGEAAASVSKLRLGPLAASVPPADLPKDRPVVGLALGGGAAVAMTEIGVLQWFDEHHIPVDVIAGTSMGSILAALYSTGHTPEQMKHILTEDAVNHVFRIQSEFSNLSFRRREEDREIPNAVTLGLKHGVSLRNSLLTDTGLNDLLDREFLNYNDQTDFNTLPIPFRCQATDLNDAKTVTFARGSLPDAVRASASLPGVFRPFEMDGHEYVDGAILENLPTRDVKAMKADVVLAVSMPLEPVGKGDLDSIIGVLSRAFAVGIESNERADRKLADVVIVPDVKGFTSNNYSKTPELAQRGYDAAEAMKPQLMKYALNDAQWETYIAHRRSKERGKAGTVLMVKVKAPTPEVTAFVNRKFQPLVGQPVDTEQVESLLADIRGDGRYEADYTVGYESPTADRPILLVSVNDKKIGPPFLDIGINLAAQTGGVTRTNLNTIFIWQDLGGYGSEFRGNVDLGFLTRVKAEYYRKVNWAGFFVAPRINVTRQPYYIYNGSYRDSERQLELAGGGGDLGWAGGRNSELRFGWEYEHVNWNATTGFDGLPDYSGNSQTVRLRYLYDNQDRGLVPHTGIRARADIGYLFETTDSPSAPQMVGQFEFAHTFGRKNVVLSNFEGGTMFNRDVQQPYRFTLGGPLRVSTLAIDQFRGTDYVLITPGYLRRLFKLPAPLGQSIYAGAAYEYGRMYAPNSATLTQQDVFFGIIAETPLGVITFAPAIGTNGQHKFNFTIGKLF